MRVARLSSTQSGGASFALDDQAITIGRLPTNSICLGGDSISRRHARIERRGNVYVLSDLGSSNGTRVNSNRVKQACLAEGDVVQFGKIEFQFTLEPQKKSGNVLPPPTTDSSSQVRFENASVTEPAEIVAKHAVQATQTFLSGGGDSATSLSRAKVIEGHQRVSILYRLSESLRSAHDADEILEKGVSILLKALPADRAVALTQSEATGEVVPRVVKQRTGVEVTDIPVSRTVVDRVMSDRVVVLCHDAASDPFLKGADSVAAHDFKSILCAPLLAEDRALGAIHLDSLDTNAPYGPPDIEFVAAVANELARSIENLRLQQEAVRNERMAAIGLTMTRIAHNIKNGLQVSAGAIELMDSEVDGTDSIPLRSKWRLVRNCLDSVSKLSSDMLSFSRAPALKPRQIDVNQAVRIGLTNVQRSLGNMGIELLLQFDDAVTSWKIDQAALLASLNNLIVNSKDALKGTSNGQITVQTALANDGALRISVSDNGSGIDERTRAELFTPFFTTKGTQGTGLGLPSVQKFAESMGGAIHVESRPGAGATFSLIVPKTPTYSNTRLS